MNRFLPAVLSLTLLLPALLPGHTRDDPRPFEELELAPAGVRADTTELPEPIAPVDTLLESSTVTLSWTITRDSSYIVEIRGGLEDTVETEGYSLTMEFDTGTYDWRVRGVDSAGPGEPSAWATFRVRDPLPIPTPLSPVGDTLTAGAIDFVWRTEWPGETEWSVSGDLDTVLVTGDTSLTFDLDSGSYHWRIRSTEDGVGGAWSDSARVTIVPVADLPVVTPLSPLNRTIGTGLIRLVWISEWRKSFVIEMRGDTTLTATVAAYKLDLQFDDEGTYEWRIRAVEGADRGPWSAWWTFSTSDEITGVEEELRAARRLDIR